MGNAGKIYKLVSLKGCTQIHLPLTWPPEAGREAAGQAKTQNH